MSKNVSKRGEVMKNSFFRSEFGKKIIAIIISITFPLGVVILIILIEVFTKMFAK